MRNPEKVLPREELFNTASHGAGALVMLVGSLILLVRHFPLRPPTLSLGFLIYGLSLITVFLASSFYHGAPPRSRWKTRLQKLDHSAIYLAIAGTYVPFLLLVLEGLERWLLLATVWILATIGIVLEFLNGERFRILSYALYLGMGWVGILVAPRLFRAMPRWAFALLLAGGLAYTIGFGFYATPRIPWHHEIWHVWVITGAVLHLAALWVLEGATSPGT